MGLSRPQLWKNQPFIQQKGLVLLKNVFFCSKTKTMIVYRDEAIVVVDKPIGLPIHKTQGMAHDADYLTKVVGLELGCSVYNVHRIDAKTSGVVVLALTPDVATELTQQFEQKVVEKSYRAIVRGVPGEGTFDQKVRNKGKAGSKNAVSHYKTLKTIRTSICYKSFENIELSLVEMRPETGRWHQLRQHFAFHRYDIIGDNEHGDRMLNKIIEENLAYKRLYLHAASLSFRHPENKEVRTFTSELPDTFLKLFEKLAI